MPTHKNRRLTPEDRQRIKVYQQVGLTGVEIAQELGYGEDQVRRYLRSLLPAIKSLPQVAIVRSQYLLIQRFEASTLTVSELAVQLEADAIILALELRGRKTMSSKRMQALKALFAAHASAA